MTKHDAAEGAYWYYALYHNGQWSEGYRRLCLIAKIFNPSPLSNNPESEEAWQIFLDMECRKVCQ